MTPVPKFTKFLLKNAVLIRFKGSPTVRTTNRMRINAGKLFWVFGFFESYF